MAQINVTLAPQLNVALTLAGQSGGVIDVLPPQPVAVELMAFMRGAKGDPGERGQPGITGGTFEYAQNIALAIWTVPHNLARYPQVTVVDTLSQRIEADVAYLDENLIQITHGTPMKGRVFCN